MMKLKEARVPKGQMRRWFNRHYLLVCLATGCIIGLAMGTAVLPNLHRLTPPGAIIVAGVLSLFFIGSTLWFLKMTDEHDRNAHLWSMTWAWLSIAVMTPSWWLFAKAGMARPVDAMQIFTASAFVGAAVWTWNRYR
jgi:hypothetical protein